MIKSSIITVLNIKQYKKIQQHQECEYIPHQGPIQKHHHPQTSLQTIRATIRKTNVDEASISITLMIKSLDLHIWVAATLVLYSSCRVGEAGDSGEGWSWFEKYIY